MLKIPLFGKFDLKTSMYFVLNETQNIMVFKGAILNSTIVFINSVPKIPVWANLFPKL